MKSSAKRCPRVPRPHERARRAGMTPSRPDSLDLLKGEDHLLPEALELWVGSGDADPVCHGSIAKFVVRHLAIREAARDDVMRGLKRTAHGESWRRLVEQDRSELRRAIRGLHEMMRGISAYELELGQDFGGAMKCTGALVLADVPAVPVWLAKSLEELDTRTALRLHSARYVRNHAPTHLRIAGPRLYERFGPLERIRAIYDRLARSPTAQDRYLPPSLVGQERRLWVR